MVKTFEYAHSFLNDLFCKTRYSTLQAQSPKTRYSKNSFDLILNEADSRTN